MSSLYSHAEASSLFSLQYDNTFAHATAAERNWINGLMCCRQATDKKGITSACLGFSMIRTNNKTKGDSFLVPEILGHKESEIGHTRECFIID